MEGSETCAASPSTCCRLERAVTDRTRIVITPLDDDSRAAIAETLLSAPAMQARLSKAFTVDAGRHRIEYRFVGEVRYGPGLYEASIEGPASKVVNGRRLVMFADRSAYYDATRDWMVFQEWAAESHKSSFHVVNLGSGERVNTIDLPAGSHFVAWRGASGEFIAGVFEHDREYSWHAVDARTGASRRIGQGGSQAYASADGEHLFALDTRRILVVLYDAEQGVELDRCTTEHFNFLTARAENVEVVSFDAVKVELTAMLNWRGTNYREGVVSFERGVAISVA